MKLKFESELIQIASLRFIEALKGSKITRVVFVVLLVYYAYAAVALIQRLFSCPYNRLIMNFLYDMLSH